MGEFPLMPATLFDHLKQCQRFIRDARMELIDPGDLISYINQARREVAMRAQCIRRLPLIYGSIVSIPIPVVTGWTGPVTVAITPPDSPSGTLPFPNGAQAIATALVMGGAITDVEVTYGGDGYFQPVATFTDAVGHTATSNCKTTVLNTLNEGQEVYPFSGINLQAFPGCQSVFSIRSVSIIYSNYRYSLPVYILFGLSGHDQAVRRLTVSICADVRSAVRTRHGWVVLSVSAAEPGVPTGVRLRVPAARPHSGRKRGGHP